MPQSRNLKLIGALVALLGAAAIAFFIFDSDRELEPSRKPLSYEELTGSAFLSAPRDPSKPPEVRELTPPRFVAATSVWGSTGRDLRGRIWVGVSASGPGASAHLHSYTPETDAWRDCGSVVDQLKAARLYSEGEGQIKIHSRIILARDGWLYFASTDEEGEEDDGTALPRWGGHLWRVDPDNCLWQHIKAVPEGLVAVSGIGRYIYALGYWGHVLYQYDTSSGSMKRVKVGSVAGHVSRNFLADVKGHVYVPRLSAKPGAKAQATLVEYDSGLQELASTPLEFYLGDDGPNENHGIIGLSYLPDGRILSTTSHGRLYLIEPGRDKPALVTDLGWFHPGGEAYAPSLFVLGREGLVAGVTNRASRFEWVVFDLNTRITGARPFDTKNLRGVLLFGSMTCDDAGRLYVGGWASAEGDRPRPLIMQVKVPPD